MRSVGQSRSRYRPENLPPESLRPWLADIANRLQVPLEFPAIPSIVIVSSVIGNQVRIRPKRKDDWTITPNLWGAIVGRPGVLKSPTIGEALKPLHRLVAEAQAAHKESLKSFGFEKEKTEALKAAAKKRLKSAAEKGRDLDQFRDQFDAEDISEPVERRYLTNDTTVEKYGELLNQNPNGLLIFRDELTGWLRSLDEDERARDRAFYLEAWDGDKPFTYDRIGRGTLHIANTTTSILGGIQPGPLEGYLRGALNQSKGDDGLFQRLQMLVYPEIVGDPEYIDEWPNKEAKNKAYEIFERLRAIDAAKLGVELDDRGKPFLRFDADAQEFFAEWYLELTRSLRAGGDHPALESHFAKYRSLMPSLALIFQLCDSAAKGFVGFEGCVSLDSAERAAAWCSFLEKHARRIYGLGLGAIAIHAKTLAEHLQKGDLEEGFTARDVYLLKGWAGLSNAKAVEGPLDLLESLGWLESVTLNTGGRPKTVYTINPRIKDVKL
jgi:Protein of unknown function (DUF3987)